MFRIPLLFLLTLPLLAWSVPAQTALTVAPQHCVWREGDDPDGKLGWAAPAWKAESLPGEDWKPYPGWKLTPSKPSIWVRCRADLSALRTLPHPAIQVSLAAAYQLFLNGKQVGVSGDLRTGQYNEQTLQTFPLATANLGDYETGIATGQDVIAIHAVYGDLTSTDPIEVTVGEQQNLQERFAAPTLDAIRGGFFLATCFGAVGLVGFLVFALYLNDRGRFEFLLLAIVCWLMAVFRITEFCANTSVPFSSTTMRLIVAICQTGPVLENWFIFKLAGRRVSRWLIAFWGVAYLEIAGAHLVGVFLPAHASLQWQALDAPLYKTEAVTALILGLTVIIVAGSILKARASKTRGMRAVALCCVAWGAADTMFFLVNLAFAFDVFTDNMFWHGVSYPIWASFFLKLRALATLSAVIALVLLFFRDQKRVARERALFAGEMQAAQEIQQLLVHSTLKSAPGLKIEAAFRPAKEVGGDFYRCRVLPTGTQRVLLGDVSGKGAAAAMTAAMLLGAAEGHDGDSPAGLLAHLNAAFKHSGLGGFATCLCLDVMADGAVSFANAGQIPPYRNGAETPCESGLPLGILDDVIYSEATLHLDLGDQLTLLSDGVLEARNAPGELFGFDRTAAISTQSAEAIATAAQTFGQDDDITVLTLTRTNLTGAAHA